MKSPYVIPEDVIQSNKDLFISIFSKMILPKYDGSKLLLEWIKSTDFFEAPASSYYHLSCRGGLCQHTLNVYNRMIQLVNTHMGDLTSMGTDLSGIALVSLCHDICKCDSYVAEYKNSKVYCDNGTKFDQGGSYEWKTEKVYRFDPDIRGFGHGGKSLWIVQNFIKNLPIDEALAIRNHAGGFEFMSADIPDPDIPKVYNSCPLAFWLHIADMISTYVDEKY